VKFFSLNALSSPILIKLHFDVLMAMIVHALNHFFSKELLGYEQCRPSTIFRHFVNTKEDIAVRGDAIWVTCPRRAHNPLLKTAQLDKISPLLSWLGGRKIVFEFE